MNPELSAKFEQLHRAAKESRRHTRSGSIERKALDVIIAAANVGQAGCANDQPAARKAFLPLDRHTCDIFDLVEPPRVSPSAGAVKA